MVRNAHLQFHPTNSFCLLVFMLRSCAQFDYAEFLKLLESHILMSNIETFKVFLQINVTLIAFKYMLNALAALVRWGWELGRRGRGLHNFDYKEL